MEKISSKYIIISSIAAVILFTAGAYVFAAYDTDKAKLALIQYPVEELGSCKNFEECQIYCNKDENIPKCMRFSIKNLYSKEDAQEAERLLNLMDESGLPGKCQNAVECFSYCESAAHLDECWDYAQRHNLIPPGGNIETTRSLAKFVREGGKFPGNCQGQAECESYCADSSHAVECMEFSLKVGFIPQEDIDDVNKILPYLKSGGKLPGGCTNKESCDTYCSSEANINECIDFAVGAGFMPKEEAEIVKKMGGKGPGDCKSREQCESFCNNPANQTTCMEFAVKVGMMSEEDAEFFKQNMARSQGAEGKGFGGFDQMPAKMKECLSNQVGPDAMAKLASKEVAPGKEMMRAMRICVEEFQNSCPAFANKQSSGEDSNNEKVGPGTMDANTEQCFKEAFGDDVLEKMKNGDFCPPENMQEILMPCFQKNFGGQEGGQFPGGEGSFQGGGPGGCKSQEECQIYCQTNPEACQGSGTLQPSGESGATPQQQEYKVDCSNFAQVPKCSYVGPEDSDNYKYCKQCYPEK